MKMSGRYYIGLATTLHDSAVAIVSDTGEILFAEAAERRYQVKRSIGCPPDNIAWTEDLVNKYCDGIAEHVITRSWSNNEVRRGSLFYSSGMLRVILKENIKKNILNITGILPIAFNNAVFVIKNGIAVAMNAGASMERVIRNMPGTCNVKNIAYDHHLSHAGLACYGSPFNEAVCWVIDGNGEGGPSSIYKYKNGKIILLEKQKGPVSLGSFYQGLTFFCGFDPLKGEEWKVMGLAAYGSFSEHLYSLFTSMYYVDGCKIRYRTNKFKAHKTFKSILELVSADWGDLSLKADVAYNGQLAYTQWMNELSSNIHKKYPSDNLILTGGCALNSSYNGEILDKTPFRDLYVPSAPADDGNALGGALLAYYADHPHLESIHKNISPYLGSEITDDQIQRFLRFSGYQKVRKLDVDKYDIAASLLSEGKIVGWVQGKAEFGPRALGNRSILADPRKKEIKDIINDRVKFREEFRPFAPSILHEFGNEYFEHYLESHYMERTLKFKKEVIGKVPGVVHEDNTGRLQSVKEEWNYELYHLLKAFHNITGIPVLLNTSFNVMGKPIIHTIEDAISTFFTTGLDALIINDHLIEK
jgi:carbamoyltransferase